MTHVCWMKCSRWLHLGCCLWPRTKWTLSSSTAPSLVCLQLDYWFVPYLYFCSWREMFFEFVRELQFLWCVRWYLLRLFLILCRCWVSEVVGKQDPRFGCCGWRLCCACTADSGRCSQPQGHWIDRIAVRTGADQLHFHSCVQCGERVPLQHLRRDSVYGNSEYVIC